jgi:hypothetical protein
MWFSAAAAEGDVDGGDRVADDTCTSGVAYRFDHRVEGAGDGHRVVTLHDAGELVGDHRGPGSLTTHHDPLYCDTI